METGPDQTATIPTSLTDIGMAGIAMLRKVSLRTVPPCTAWQVFDQRERCFGSSFHFNRPVTVPTPETPRPR
jgi:hypothetical protein